MKETKLMLCRKDGLEQDLAVNLKVGKVNEIWEFCYLGRKTIKDGYN